MKYFEVEKNITKIEPNSFVIDEDTRISIHQGVTLIDKEAVRGTSLIHLEIDYEGTTEDWNRIERGEELHWIEYSDYSPSYGSSTVYSQQYSNYTHWTKNVIFPIIIHCSNGDLEDYGKQPNRYIIRHKE